MKKILPVAVLAALAGVNAAQAVHVNPDGTGQVLIFPYYTVEAGQDTYINLVNTTDTFKAVKIRIMESMNSQEVLDFNIYLSPEDHWSAVITSTADGASIKSNDKSCTVPISISQGTAQPFRDFLYRADSVNGPARTREGYIEVIEMGTVTGSQYTSAINHTNGVPNNCGTLVSAWNAGGSWTTSGGLDGMSAVAGGLYGYGVLIDVDNGTDASYDAVAIDDWINQQGNQIVHTPPATTLPSIVSGADAEYDVFDEGGVVSGEADSGRDSVSATLMQASISNDYVLENDIAAGTSWVVTFPTKRFYINGGDPSPFTSSWSSSSSEACEEIGIEYWDREEGTQTVDDEDFSPPRPGPEASAFCYEANVLTFNGGDDPVLSPSARSRLDVTLDPGFENGWARIDFVETSEGPRELVTLDHVFFGLPVVGFAVQQYVNGELPNGVLSNYQGTDLHKGNREIISSSAP